MEGINRLTSQVMELNLTVSKVEQDHRTTHSTPMTDSYATTDDPESRQEPSTGLESVDQLNRSKRLPYGV